MSKNKTTATTTHEPWSPAQGALKGVLGQAQTAYNNGTFETTPYQGQRVASFSPTTQSALGQMGNPSAMTGDAMSAWQDFMGADPYRDFAGIKQTVADDVNANLGSRFAGDLNNSLVQQSFARGMSDSLGGLEFDAYNRFRDQQMAGISMAPSLQNMGVVDNQQMLQSGSLQDARAQAQINANMQKYQEQQSSKKNALIEYSNLVSGVGGMGGASSTSTPQNMIGNVASAGLNGLGTYGMLMSNPVTAPLGLAGGALAGLGSLF